MILAVMQLRVFQPHFLKLIAFDDYNQETIDRYVREVEERPAREQVTIQLPAPQNVLSPEDEHHVPQDVLLAQTPLEQQYPLGVEPVDDSGTPPQEANGDNPPGTAENTKDKTVIIGQYTFSIESGAYVLPTDRTKYFSFLRMTILWVWLTKAKQYE